MGIFNRKGNNAEIGIVAQAVPIDPPTLDAGELEQMVYEVYREKLELEKQVENDRERIRFLEEQQTKLRAAETFSRQSESTRKQAVSRNRELEERIAQLEQEIEQERAKVAARDLKIRKLVNADVGRMDECRRELIGKMKQGARGWSGNWSKQKVLRFLDSFMPGNCELDAETPPSVIPKATRGDDTNEEGR